VHKILFATIAGCLVTFQPVHAVSPATGTDGIAAIVKDFDAFSRAQDPIRAAQRGDQQAARLWPDNSPLAVTARKAAYQAFQQRLQSLPGTGLAGDDELSRQVLVDRVSLALDGFDFDEERLPFISGDGFYTTADYAALNTVLGDEAAAAAWIARLEALPAYYAREIENMRRRRTTRRRCSPRFATRHSRFRRTGAQRSRCGPAACCIPGCDPPSNRCCISWNRNTCRPPDRQSASAAYRRARSTTPTSHASTPRRPWRPPRFTRSGKAR
jgi:hypothetical protein